MRLRRPARCPKCHGQQVRAILYGKPGPEALAMVDRGEAVLGGCFVAPWQPDWECQTCLHRWSDPDDPAKQETEAILARARRRKRAAQPPDA